MSQLLEFGEAVYNAQPDHLSEMGSPSLGRMATPIESAVTAMNKGDWVSVGKRAQTVACLRGASPANIGNGYSNYRIAPSIGTPGERAIQSVGLAVASSRPVLCILGTSALADGQLLEAIQLAGSLEAPVLFLLITHANSPSEVATVLSAPHKAFAASLEIPVHQTTNEDLHGLVKKSRKKQRPAIIEFSL